MIHSHINKYKVNEPLIEVKQNSLRAWWLAARPKTLFGAVSPVLAGAAVAWATMTGAGMESTSWIIPSAFCMLFALAMQVDANFINDYFDFKRGADSEERLGPERACTRGWITPGAMKTGIIITTIIASVIGLPLIYYGGWAMVVVGVLCILGAFLYTTKFSYTGLGDIMVILYFGIVPVFFTWFVSTWLFFSNSKGGFTDEAFLGNMNPTAYYFLMGGIALIAGFAVGFVVDNLLIVNNYRDRELDKKNGKNTMVVKLGAKAAEWIYLLNGCFGVAGALIAGSWLKRTLASNVLENGLSGWRSFPFCLLIPLLFLPFVFSAHRKMVRINRGRQLNSVLGLTSRNILIFSLLAVAGIIITTLAVCYNR